MADQFDPNQPFEVVNESSSSEGFDPNQPFEMVDEGTSSVNPLESYARGLAQTGSLGFADEGTGAAEALYKKYQGAQEPLQDLYTQSRDESRANYDKAQAANPTSYLGGQLTGSLVPGLLSGGAGVGALAAQGALQGLGSSEADLTKGNVGSAAIDAGIGGAIGGAAGLAGQALSKVPVGAALNYTGDKLRGGAEYLAKAATGAEGLADDAGRELLDQGIVKFGDTAGNIAKRASQIPDEGNTLSGLVSPIKKAASQPGFASEGSFSPSDLAVAATTGLKGLIAKKVIAPRAASSSAVLADNIGQALQSSPQVFGKFAAPLQAAAARGGTALAATNFVLQQTNPEYRSIVFGNEDEDNDN